VLLPPLLESGADIVVDHMGLPDPALGVGCRGLGAIIDAAASGRVWIKLSAPYRVGPSAPTVAQHLLRAVSSDRLLWGSDWPWTNHEAGRTYAGCLSWLVPLCRDATTLQRVLVDTALRLHWR
jgi:predicted TIM-barrel fold metal-dependent hydrolase